MGDRDQTNDQSQDGQQGDGQTPPAGDTQTQDQADGQAGDGGQRNDPGQSDGSQQQTQNRGPGWEERTGAPLRESSRAHLPPEE